MLVKIKTRLDKDVSSEATPTSTRVSLDGLCDWMVALLEIAPVVHEKDTKNLEVGPTWDGSSRRLWLSACYDVPGEKTIASSGRLPLTRSHSSTDRKDGGGTYGVHVREKAGDAWSKNGVRITRDGFVQLMKMMPDLVDRCFGSAGMTEDEARYVIF